jgi:hypothetical protein
MPYLIAFAALDRRDLAPDPEAWRTSIHTVGVRRSMSPQDEQLRALA